MFEEHMRRIIYNWKSARRRENNAKSKKKGKSRLRTRSNGQRLKRSQHSSSEELTPPSSPVRKSITPRKCNNSIANGHASTSKANGPVARPIIRVKPNNSRLVANKTSHDDSTASESDGGSSSSESEPVINTLPNSRNKRKPNSDSEDSYRPNSRGKKIVRNTRSRGKQKKTKNNYCSDSESDNEVEEEENEIRTRTTSRAKPNGEDEYDSDDEPLINCRSAAVESDGPSWNCASSASGEVALRHVQVKTSKFTSPARSLRSSHVSQDESSQGSSARPTRSTKKNYEESDGSDDEEQDEEEDAVVDEEEEDDEEVELPQRSARAKRMNYRSMLVLTESEGEGGGGGRDGGEPSSSVRTRRGKRPRYNEDSEDSAVAANTRGTKRRAVNDDSDNSTANEPAISISSRGRVRRLTARARALLRE